MVEKRTSVGQNPECPPPGTKPEKEGQETEWMGILLRAGIPPGAKFPHWKVVDPRITPLLRGTSIYFLTIPTGHPISVLKFRLEHAYSNVLDQLLEEIAGPYREEPALRPTAY